MPVDHHAAFKGLVESGDEMNEGSLSAAGFSHDRNGLAGIGRKGYMFEHGKIAVGILESHISELNKTFETLRMRYRIAFILISGTE